MALVYDTTLVPGKLDLLAAWLPTRPWFEGGVAPRFERAGGGFRLDDPAGEVGIEFVVVADTSGLTPVAYLTPMTYRGAPLDGADDALIGTSEHGVLGKRWFYDAPHDPVFVEQLARLLSGDAQPQDRNESDTIDSSVTVLTAGFNSPTTGFDTASATDTTRWTEIAFAADHQVIRLHRIITPDTSPATRVEAPWSTADGVTIRGVFASITP
ncbi:1,4-alpha-glucan branching protein [Nocardia sp. SYP-A9097]|uniref:maltokinase N-terminal cap-like domain-containing protein n=1 Tax=Nocardia sp. SYP-A9097 TaxID=2663237 RepID=UPI00129B2345|nr:1,4-alpha-glucan branching protein [Nocardia sp. SYP-A9097]MRH90546.1 1,4-alpha-glucan branching protein [Nocardia sp. SYP-A9097]